jgi:hypothetical protein
MIIRHDVVVTSLSSLKFLSNEKGAIPTQAGINAFDDTTIEQMGAYFHVQDREVLLRYLRDVMISVTFEA